jgi:hypothetical protein
VELKRSSCGTRSMVSEFLYSPCCDAALVDLFYIRAKLLQECRFEIRGPAWWGQTCNVRLRSAFVFLVNTQTAASNARGRTWNDEERHAHAQRGLAILR